MADITPEVSSVTGTDLTETAAADPLTFSNNGRALLIAINTSGAERTFEIVTTKTEESGLLGIDELPITIGAADEYTLLGVYGTSLYNDGSNEVTLQTFNSVTGLSFLAIQT